MGEGGRQDVNIWLRLILSLSLSGGILACILFAVTRLLGSRLGQKWQYYIWLLVVLRMVLPVAAPINLTGALFDGYGLRVEENSSDGVRQPVLNEKESGMADGSGNAFLMAEEEDLPADALEEFGDSSFISQPYNKGTVPSDKVTGLFGAGLQSSSLGSRKLNAVFWQFAAVLWLAAATGLFFRKLWSYRRAVRLLRMDCMDTDQFAAPFEAACNVCGLRRKPKLFVSRNVPVPAAFGVFCPAVAVPADFPRDKVYYAFLHELTHIRRCDALYKWVVEIVVCMHFFNPMAYVLRRETARTCELSCDETVIRRLAGENKRAYGDMLLASLRHGMMPSHTAMTLSLGENARWMKERLGAIMKFRKKSHACMFFTFVLTALLSAGALLCGFAPAQKSDNTGGTTNKINWDSAEILRRPDQKGCQTTMFWESGYFVALAWNVDSSQYGTVRQIGGKPVCYTEKVKRYADDAKVTNVLRLAIADREGKDGFQGKFPLEEAVFLGIDGPYDGTPDDLAWRFYEDGNLEYFAAIIDEAEIKTVEALAERTVEDGKTDFFAIAAGELPDDSLSQYTKTAYKENNIDIFAIAAGKLPDNEARDLAKQAVKDGKEEFFSIVMSSLTDSEIAKLSFDAYDSGQIHLFYMTCNNLNAQQADEIAEKAYLDGQIDYMYAISYKMTDAKRADLRKRAKQEGKTEFWYALTE